jgi:LysM repeat protein
MFIALLFVVVIGLCGALIAFQAESVRSVAEPTPRPTRDVLASSGLTATPTSLPTEPPTETETPSPTNTPAPTNTPLPTNTPRPPRFHNVETGESLIGISLRYGGITVDSIAEANSLDLNNPLIQVGQDIIIPWPSPTPPLQAIVAEVGEDKVLVDPSVCPPFYEIKEGDTLFQLAAVNRVPLEAMLAINYLTIDSVLQPGDVICIPNVEIGGILPPTPGPSPTPSLTPPPPGPRLLYPAPGATVENPAGVVALQWLVVQDLAPDEYYMVEVTDLTAVDSYPRRGFTRQTSFQVPADWRADEAEEHEFRWRVSLVRVTGEREDGSFIYTYGGRASQDGTFFWLGAVPTPTPTLTPTPTNTPTPSPTPSS